MCVQLLSDLLPLAATDLVGLSWSQWTPTLFAMKNHRLHDMPLSIFGAMLTQQQAMLEKEPPSAANVSSELRLPAKCTAMILEGVVKSPGWAAAAAASGQAPTATPISDLPSSSLAALFAGADIPASLRGVDLAERMLLQMISPPMASRFQVNQVAWNVVLQGLTQLCGDRRSAGFEQRMQRVRSFYDSIPDKDSVTHGILLTAYQRAGMDSEAMALHGDPSEAMTPSVTSARLTHVYHQLNSQQRRSGLTTRNPTAQLPSSKEIELLQEAEEMWQAAMEQPLQRMDAAVTGSMQKLYHLTGDIPRQLQIIQEALRVESQQSKLRPVYVNAACYSQLFHSLALSSDPPRYAAEARAAYDSMQQRNSSARQANNRTRANQLQISDSAFSAYLKYLQRSRQAGELRQAWIDMPRGMKQGNPRIFTVMFNAFASIGDYLDAEMLMKEMEDLGMQPGIEQVNAQLACYQLQARWSDAEQVWQRMIEDGLHPDSATHTEMMQIYMTDGSPAQLAKIAALHSAMHGAAPPIHMQPRNYERLIKTAHRCRLGSEARAWSDRARAAGVWEELDAATHTIVAGVAQWENRPRRK